jgi:predicted outer membrane repeat protein
MKNSLYSLIILIIFNFNTTANANLNNDTITWSGQIELTENVYFGSGETLHILAGTTVTTNGPFKIELQGNIYADGTAELPILFTASDTIGLMDSAVFAGGWLGIHLINNLNGIAVFRHCTFEYGKANIPGSWYAMSVFQDTLSGNQGGVIRAKNYNQVVFENCVFSYNFARTYGGAVYIKNTHLLEISDCVFVNNKTLLHGGGIFADDADFLSINDSHFFENTAWFYYIHPIVGPHFNGDGAAFHIKCTYPNESVSIIHNNQIFNNSSLTSVFLNTHYVHMYNNVITNNFSSAALFFSRLPSINIVHSNTIANNYFWASIPGIHTASEDMTIYNNVFWNNFSDIVRPQDLVIQWHNHQPTVFHNLIWEGRAPGGPMITDDPLFVNPAPGYGLDYNGWEYDWSLQDDSPAVNSGTPDTTGLFLPPYDILSNPRIFGGRIDMGAYENQNVWVSLPNNPLVNARLVAAPNPFRNAFTVELFGPEKVKRITVYNQTGTPVRQMETLWHEGLVSIDMSGFTSGLYVLAVEYENGTVRTEKMVKM